MKLNFITFMVRDIEKSKAFYMDIAGLKVINTISHGGYEIVFLANSQGETMIELIEFESAEKLSVSGMFFSFKAEGSLEDLREKAISLGYSPSEIIANGPKPAYFTIKDPDGVIIEFGI